MGAQKSGVNGWDDSEKSDSPLSLLFRFRQKWMSESLPHSVCIKREEKLDGAAGKEWRY
jgi:hypothetical protein